MLVETYENNEVTDKGLEIESEAMALIEKLGLEGQKTLVKGTDENSARVPYTQMSAEENMVYRTLYPDTMRVEAYDRGPIPIRVLQVISYCREQSLFDNLVIWCPKQRDPDPLLIGYNGPVYSPRNFCLLARWGDALDSFDKLRERAVKILTEQFVARARQAISVCETAIREPDIHVLKQIRGESDFGPWGSV